MSHDRMREIAVLALAQNADPNDANAVISQAISGLIAEAQVLRAGLETGEDTTVLAFTHEGRLEALENLFDHFMTAKWNDAVEAKAAE